MRNPARGAAQAAVVDATEPLAPPSPARGDASVFDPLYPVALLKIAMAMRRLAPEAEAHFEAILDSVLDDMVIDRGEFQAYLRRNLGRLVAMVERAVER